MRLIACAVVVFGVQYLGIKEFTRRYYRGTVSYMNFEAWYLGIAAVVLAIWKGVSIPQHMATGICALLFGVGIAGAFFLNSAFSEGPMATASMLMTTAVLVPVLVDMLAFGKCMSEMQFLAFVLLGVGFVVLGGGGNGTRYTARYMRYCFTAAGWNGIMLSSLSVQQRICKGEEQVLFLILGLAAGAAVAMVFLFTRGGKEERSEVWETMHRNVFWVLVIVVAMVTMVGNLLNIEISNRVSAVIQFPCVIGGGIIFNMISAAIMYREKIEKKQWAGFILCLIALTGINQ